MFASERLFFPTPLTMMRIKTRPELNGPSTVCWTCGFFCLADNTTNKRIVFVATIGGRANKRECERVYSDLSEFVPYTEECGGGTGGDITQCTAVPCVPNQELGKNPRNNGKNNNKRTGLETRAAASPTRGEEKKKKPHCGKSPDCEVLLINGLSERA